MHQTWVVFELIWYKDVSLKVFDFVWCLLRNRLSIKNNLGSVLLDERVLYVYGCGGVESVHHLFLNFNIFGFSCYLVCDWVEVSTVDPNSIVDHFHNNAYLSSGSKQRQSFMRLLWLTIVWVIWQERNDIIFNNKAKSMSHLLDKVKYLSTWCAAEEKCCKCFY